MFLVQMLTCIMLFLEIMLLVCSLYAIVMAMFSFRGEKKVKTSSIRHRFAILVAARNEAAVVGSLIDSLLQQNYPRSLFDIIVIPNNCTDQTRIVAQKSGAMIMDCPIRVQSKGDVLNYAFSEICRSSQAYDAICVFDADNLVHPDFLLEMNHSIGSGAQVAQCYRDSKNPFDTAVSGSSAIYFWLLIRFFNRARSAIGLSAGISGSGFMIRTDLIRKMNGVNTVTITEDLELSVLCCLAGEKIFWVPRAIIYDEQPLTFDQSWHQRMRWTSGMYQINTLYRKKLLVKTVKERNMQSLDLFILCMTAHMHVFSFVAMMILGLLTLLRYLDGHIELSTIGISLFASILMTLIACTGVAIITVRLEKKEVLRFWKGILSFWLYMLIWLPINIICLFKKTTSWKVINHSRIISIEDLAIKADTLEQITTD